MTSRVAIEEVRPSDWLEKVYRPDIEPQMDKLYKKPGYGPSESLSETPMASRVLVVGVTGAT